MESEIKDGNNMSHIDRIEREIIDFACEAQKNEKMWSFTCQKILEGENKEMYQDLKKLVNFELAHIRTMYRDDIKQAAEMIFNFSNYNEKDEVKIDNMLKLINETRLLLKGRC